LGAGALKKVTKDAHHRDRCIVLVSLSGLFLSFTSAFKISNTSSI
jgi:hypothetical protein